MNRHVVPPAAERALLVSTCPAGGRITTSGASGRNNVKRARVRTGKLEFAGIYEPTDDH